jgi:hypothetical protein
MGGTSDDDRRRMVRLVTIVLQGPEQVVPALEDLAQCGFSTSQMGLLAYPYAFLELHKTSAKSGRGEMALSYLLSATGVAIEGESSKPLEFRCGVELAGLLASRPCATESDWLLPEVRKSLAAHASTGATVLFVSAHDAGQQSKGTRLLLLHGRHGLQTHEFSWSGNQ